MTPEQVERIKAQLAELMRTCAWDVRQCRLAIERGETEAAIEALQRVEKMLANFELEFDLDRRGRGPRAIHNGNDDTGEA